VSVPEIDVDALAALQPGGASIIDVREVDEYRDGHVAGAVLIPLGQVSDRVAEVPTDSPVYVICKSGGRSLRAAEWLIAQGVDASNVVGGTMAWIGSGRPVVVGGEPA
jgi:rhodanese-related sulfurtransferase